MPTFSFFHLRRDNPAPLYYQIEQAILSAIHDGRLLPGDALPAEFELCDQLVVSRLTIRQAPGGLYAMA